MILIAFLKKYSFYALLLLILSFFTFEKYVNHQNGWRSELWADQGGYYVLLPSVFIYHLDAKKLPKDIANRLGNGFSVDTVTNKINTRYTYGVALLQAPFFLYIHYCTKIPEEAHDGFSDPYYQVPNLAALFYSFTGIVFLIQFLSHYFSRNLSILTSSCIFLGTNLFYYATDSTGMSHIYSFFLFAVFLYLTGKLIHPSRRKTVFFLFWCITYCSIVLVRPVNLVLILIPIFLDCRSLNDVVLRIKEYANWKYLSIFLLTVVVMFLPQFLYWKYLSGKWFYDTYPNESFSNWNHPKLIELLFSPNNGLFLYNPLFIVIIGGMAYMVLKKINNGVLISCVFLLLLYISSAWYSFSLACGFGHRAWVEYTAVFALPLGYILSEIYVTRKKIKYFVTFFIFVCLAFNLKLIFSFDKCFIGADWDFKEYTNLVMRGAYYKSINFKGHNMSAKEEFSEGIVTNQSSYSGSSFRRALVKGDVEFYNPNSMAEIVFTIEKNGKTLYWASILLTNKEQKIFRIIDLPKDIDLNSEISVFIWNKEKKFLKLKQLELQLK